MSVHVCRHDTLESCMAGFFNCGESELLGMPKFEFEDSKGRFTVWPVRRVLRVRKKRGTWGWVENKGDIHIWVAPHAPFIKVLRLLAHELGHKERPYFKASITEERKAEQFADVAMMAYTIAMDVVGAVNK